jgi:16S rRNA (guanine(527)-N(7))-methyltransferase RsmG
MPAMNNSMTNSPFQQAVKLLKEENGIDTSPEIVSRLKEYTALIRRWNKSLHLVSEGDLDQIEDIHIVDAFSLATYIRKFANPESGILDIGSGGGFPIIPLKCLLPDLPCTLLERNEGKVGFLHRVVARLELTDIEVVHGAFPESVNTVTASVITARAVERPEKFVPALLSRMPETSVFLCQAPLDRFTVPETFHVEHINDFWAYAGLRRGTLTLFQKKPS